jgi:hypothetical protein
MGDENNKPPPRRGSVKDIAKMFGGKGKVETAESFHNKKGVERAKARAMTEQASQALRSVRTGGVSVFEEKQATQRETQATAAKHTAAKRNTKLAAAKQTAEEVNAIEEVQILAQNKALYEEKVVSTISERVERCGTVCSVIPVPIVEMEYSPERPTDRGGENRYDVDDKERGSVVEDVNRLEEQCVDNVSSPQPGGEQCKGTDEPVKADFTSPIYSTPSKPPLHKRASTAPRRLSGDLVSPHLSSPDSDDDFIGSHLTSAVKEILEDDDLPISPTRARSCTWGGSDEGTSPRVRSLSCSNSRVDDTGDSIIFDDSFDSDSDVEEGLISPAQAAASPTADAADATKAATPTSSSTSDAGSSSGGKVSGSGGEQRQRATHRNRPIGARTHRHSLSPSRLAEAGRARSVSSPPLPMTMAAPDAEGAAGSSAAGMAMGMGRLLGWGMRRGKGTSAVRGDGNIAKARLFSTDLKEFAAQIITQDRFLGSSAAGGAKFGAKTKRMMPPVLVERTLASITVEWVGAPLCKRFELQYARTSGLSLGKMIGLRRWLTAENSIGSSCTCFCITGLDPATAYTVRMRAMYFEDMWGAFSEESTLMVTRPSAALAAQEGAPAGTKADAAVKAADENANSGEEDQESNDGAGQQEEKQRVEGDEENMNRGEDKKLSRKNMLGSFIRSVEGLGIMGANTAGGSNQTLSEKLAEKWKGTLKERQTRQDAEGLQGYMTTLAKQQIVNRAIYFKRLQLLAAKKECDLEEFLYWAFPQHCEVLADGVPEGAQEDVPAEGAPTAAGVAKEEIEVEEQAQEEDGCDACGDKQQQLRWVPGQEAVARCPPVPYTRGRVRLQVAQEAWMDASVTATENRRRQSMQHWIELFATSCPSMPLLTWDPTSVPAADDSTGYAAAKANSTLPKPTEGGPEMSLSVNASVAVLGGWAPAEEEGTEEGIIVIGGSDELAQRKLFKAMVKLVA